MRKLVVLLVALAISVPFGTSVEAGPRHAMASWRHLTPEQQSVLAPLRDRWDVLPYKRRERLLVLVSRYPKMSQMEQRRFQQRLPQWASLSRSQRDLARQRYLAFSKLPEARKAELSRHWREQHLQLSGEVPNNNP